MTTYTVLPEFRRRRERRVRGLLTVPQFIAAIGLILFPVLAFNAHVVWGVVAVGLSVLVFIALSPHEGELLGLLWLYHLRACLRSVVLPAIPFADVSAGSGRTTVTISNADGVLVATEVELDG